MASRNADFDLGFNDLPFFHRLPSGNAFNAARFHLDGRTVGLLRIPSFDPRDYGKTCVSEWERFRRNLATTCESKCEGEFWDAMADRLLDDLGARIRQMKEAGAEILAVDVTENRGGFRRLYHGAATLLAGRELPEPNVEIAANRETVRSLKDAQRAIERALVFCPASAARRNLEAAYWGHDAAIAEASLPCDRSAVWSDWGVRPACAGLVSFEYPDGQTLSEVESVSVRGGAAPGGGRPNPPPRPHWHGGLALLTNRDTGSAAELFAGLLKDYAGATIVGQRTSGSGGGWMFGWACWPLSHLPLDLCIPDHVTYRRNGASYHEGVRPDIPVGLGAKEKPLLKARRLFEALRTIIKKEQEPG